MSELCLLDAICDALGLPRKARMVEVLDRMKLLQYYIRQLDRIERISDG